MNTEEHTKKINFPCLDAEADESTRNNPPQDYE